MAGSDDCLHNFRLSILFSFINPVPEPYMITYSRMAPFLSFNNGVLELDAHGVCGSQERSFLDVVGREGAQFFGVGDTA